MQARLRASVRRRETESSWHREAMSSPVSSRRRRRAGGGASGKPRVTRARERSRPWPTARRPSSGTSTAGSSGQAVTQSNELAEGVRPERVTPDGPLEPEASRARPAQRDQVAAAAERTAEVPSEGSDIGTGRTPDLELQELAVKGPHFDGVDRHPNRGGNDGLALAGQLIETLALDVFGREGRATCVISPANPRQAAFTWEGTNTAGRASPIGSPVRSSVVVAKPRRTVACRPSRPRPGTGPVAWPCPRRRAARRWRRDRGCRYGRRAARPSARRTRSTMSWEVGPAGLSTTSTPWTSASGRLVSRPRLRACAAGRGSRPAAAPRGRWRRALRRTGTRAPGCGACGCAAPARAG